MRRAPRRWGACWAQLCLSRCGSLGADSVGRAPKGISLFRNPSRPACKKPRPNRPPAPLPRSWGNAGAVWDIFRREDVPSLCAFLRQNAPDFVHSGRRVRGALGGDEVNFAAPVLSQRFMLVARHKRALKAAQVEAWSFEQMPREAVFIPGGCPHQVRLRARARIHARLPAQLLAPARAAAPARMHTCVARRWRSRPHPQPPPRPPAGPRPPARPPARCATCGPATRWRSTLCRRSRCTRRRC